jgi:2-polyprenyl-6-methoxyphenol hydroxylase-like FAD-dependent oxidoreductase
VRVLVVGGGIGGLTAGIALRRAGIDVVVYERAATLEAVGAGLVLAPNALAALARIGLEEAVRSRGAEGARLTIRTARGRVLLRNELHPPGLTMVGIHRAALQEALVTALDPEALGLGAELTGFEESDGSIVAHFADRSEAQVDVLVGADGIRSLVRARLLHDGAPRYAGYAGWRAVAEPPAGLVPPGTFSESWGRGIRFGIVDVGGGRVYWFVSQNAREGDWERSGVKEEFLFRLRGWHEPVEALVAATDEAAISGLGIYDRPPAKRWGAGRATLLGDAAHPMTPNVGQGACQAIEDAVVLAACLSEGGDPAAALRRYEARRIPRTSAIVRRSWQLGRLAQAPGPPLTWLRDAIVRATPERVQRAQQRRLLDPRL